MNWSSGTPNKKQWVTPKLHIFSTKKCGASDVRQLFAGDATVHIETGSKRTMRNNWSCWEFSKGPKQWSSTEPHGQVTGGIGTSRIVISAIAAGDWHLVQLCIKLVTLLYEYRQKYELCSKRCIFLIPLCSPEKQTWEYFHLNQVTLSNQFLHPHEFLREFHSALLLTTPQLEAFVCHSKAFHF